MSEHKTPIRVPKLYIAASKIARAVKENGQSLKQLVFSDKYKHYNIKGLYGLVTETLSRGTILDILLEKTEILTREEYLNKDPWMVRVLITELLWRKKRLLSGASRVQTVLLYEPKFKAELKTAEDSNFNVLETGDVKVGRPRYVRVNTLLSSIEDVIEIFQAEGWQLDVTPDSYQAFLQCVSNLSEDHFIQDLHMKELLIFPKRTEFFYHHLYQNGSILLQNKSSLLPVHLLDPCPNSVVLDMCAAPGMKTTHIVAKMKNKGTIYAVEKNPSRYETLCELVEKSGASFVKTIRNDVLMVDSSNCPNVEYILLDPTCSGSGIVDRVSMYPEEKCSLERLQGLASFQVILLEHALSKFPNVKRVVYSTCSLNVEENEEVVEKALSYTKANPSNPQFRLASNLLKGSWVSRGSTHYQHGAHTLYARPETDLTNGFFIAVFDRIEDNPQKYENKILKHTNKVDLEMTKCKSSKNEENGVKLSSQKYKTPTAEKNIKTINKVNKEIKLVELDDDAMLSNKKRKRNTSDRDEDLKYYTSIKKKLTKGKKLSDLEIQSVVGLINKQNSKQKKRKKQ